jgi:hypothetical protein
MDQISRHIDFFIFQVNCDKHYYVHRSSEINEDKTIKKSLFCHFFWFLVPFFMKKLPYMPFFDNFHTIFMKLLLKNNLYFFILHLFSVLVIIKKKEHLIKFCYKLYLTNSSHF